MSKEFIPKVSIVIPVYNGSDYLEDAIISALNQTYKNIEIIVVDDGSDDNGATWAIIEKYSKRIRGFRKQNGGVSSALNFGIKQMTGEYFSWLSHDDYYLPKKIEKSVDVLAQNIENADKLIAYVDGNFVNPEKKKIKSFKKFFRPIRIYTGLEAADIVSRKGTLFGCSLLIPKNAFDKSGLFDENLRYSQDALMWYRLFMNDFSICSSDYLGVLSRIHSRQVTVTRKDLFLHDSLYVAKLLAPELSKHKSIYWNYTKRLTRLSCDHTVDYMVEFARKYDVLSNNEIKWLEVERKKGRIIYNAKAFVKRIILK